MPTATKILTPDAALRVLDARAAGAPCYSYKLLGDGGNDGGAGAYGLDFSLPDELELDEGRMAATIPFADGNRRDGVGDLLEIGGIDTSRHRKNPCILFDHGKGHGPFANWPIAAAEDPATRTYTVELDTGTQVARAKAFFWDGAKGLPDVLKSGGSGQTGEFALYCEQLYHLLVKRYLRAGSIGYQVIAARELWPDESTGTPKGLHLLKTRMLEASLVVLPANGDTVRKGLAGPDLNDVLCRGGVCCGKPLSPYLVKSLAPYAPARKAQLGYEGKSFRPGDVVYARHDLQFPGDVEDFCPARAKLKVVSVRGDAATVARDDGRTLETTTGNLSFTATKKLTGVKTKAVDVGEVERALRKVGEELANHVDPAPMPGYGQVYVNDSDVGGHEVEVWYVGGDGDEDGFVDLVEEKIREAFPGVSKITCEAEALPEGEGWRQVYPERRDEKRLTGDDPTVSRHDYDNPLSNQNVPPAVFTPGPGGKCQKALRARYGRRGAKAGNYFASCPRDDAGHCTTGGGGGADDGPAYTRDTVGTFGPAPKQRGRTASVENTSRYTAGDRVVAREMLMTFPAGAKRPVLFARPGERLEVVTAGGGGAITVINGRGERMDTTSLGVRKAGKALDALRARYRTKALTGHHDPKEIPTAAAPWQVTRDRLGFWAYAVAYGAGERAGPFDTRLEAERAAAAKNAASKEEAGRCFEATGVQPLGLGGEIVDAGRKHMHTKAAGDAARYRQEEATHFAEWEKLRGERDKLRGDLGDRAPGGQGWGDTARSRRHESSEKLAQVEQQMDAVSERRHAARRQAEKYEASRGNAEVAGGKKPHAAKPAAAAKPVGGGGGGTCQMGQTSAQTGCSPARKALPAGLRTKYRAVKGLRRRVKRSAPGTATMRVKAERLGACRKAALTAGVKFEQAGDKVRLTGDDAALDNLAKTYGVRGAKAMQTKGGGPNEELRRARQFGENYAYAEREVRNPKQVERDFETWLAQHADSDESALRQAYENGKSGKSVKTKALSGQEGGNVDDETLPDGGQIETGDPAAGGDDAPAAEEKYGAQVLRRMHEDARILLEEYDDLRGPLEHDQVDSLIEAELEAIVEKLENIEAAWGDHYEKDYGALEGAGTGGDEDAAEEFKGATDDAEAVGADSEEEELPDGDAVAAGMGKRLDPALTKSLKARYGKKGHACACGGKAAPAAKTKAHGDPLLGNDGADLGVEGAHTPGNEEQDKDFPAADAADDELSVQHKWLPHHHKHVGRASTFLKGLAGTDEWTEEHQKDAGYFHKALTDVAEELGVQSKSETDPLLGNDGADLGVEGAHTPGNEESDGGMETKAGGAAPPDAATDASESQIPGDLAWQQGEGAEPAHAVPAAAKYLKELSDTVTLTDGHREQAWHHAKSLDAAAAADEPAQDARADVTRGDAKQFPEAEKEDGAADVQDGDAKAARVKALREMVARNRTTAAALNKKMTDLSRAVRVRA